MRAPLPAQELATLVANDCEIPVAAAVVLIQRHARGMLVRRPQKLRVNVQVCGIGLADAEASAARSAAVLAQAKQRVELAEIELAAAKAVLATASVEWEAANKIRERWDISLSDAEQRLSAWTLRDVHRRQLERKRAKKQRQLELEVLKRQEESKQRQELEDARRQMAEQLRQQIESTPANVCILKNNTGQTLLLAFGHWYSPAQVVKDWKIQQLEAEIEAIKLNRRTLVAQKLAASGRLPSCRYGAEQPKCVQVLPKHPALVESLSWCAAVCSVSSIRCHVDSSYRTLLTILTLPRIGLPTVCTWPLQLAIISTYGTHCRAASA
eukprot:SAG31_NODE_2936_length_4892_cov_5.112456_4_plen_325_part_00